MAAVEGLPGDLAAHPRRPPEDQKIHVVIVARRPARPGRMTDHVADQLPLCARGSVARITWRALGSGAAATRSPNDDVSGARFPVVVRQTSGVATID
nr:hypothetical protein StreXyl84_00390 [Streptomyces sp. Xyl84]